MTGNFQSLTTQFRGRTNHPSIDIGITEVYDPNSAAPKPTVREYKGIWDTGASNSVISSKIVNELGLKPTGLTTAHTANGQREAKTYLVNIYLPNKTAFVGVRVTECDALAGGLDALVGMDIITAGDFAITNEGGNTCISFRVPSIKRIDYNEEANLLREQNQRTANYADPEMRRKMRNRRKQQHRVHR